MNFLKVVNDDQNTVGSMTQDDCVTQHSRDISALLSFISSMEKSA